MREVDLSMSISNPQPSVNIFIKIGSALVGIALLSLLIAFLPSAPLGSELIFTIFVVTLTIGSLLFTYGLYANKHEGIKNDWVYFKSMSGRGILAWLSGIVLTGFYVLLYWYPSVLGFSESANSGLVKVFDPLSYLLKGSAASQWFVYGTLYTLAIILMGIKFIAKYRHNRYQVIRTISVMFFQLCFAFLLPEFLQALNQPYFDFKNMWPLNYYFFFDWNLNTLKSSGALGMFMLVWGIAMIVIISPILTYFYGKRWYCSWVCGCGGLAETAGDPFRQHSDKSLRAWKVERWLIHAVLVFAVFMTVLVLYTYFTGNSKILFFDSYKVRSFYGFLIGAAFSGVIGVGFYPIMGSRVWCRFGCPMAAILGIQQRFFSRFRITTNGGQCISCGNCSTYCEMGIDVRSYAQKGQNIVRASCVGCGICAAVCPRGVLRLENGGDVSERTEIKPVQVTEEGINLLR